MPLGGRVHEAIPPSDVVAFRGVGMRACNHGGYAEAKLACLRREQAAMQGPEVEANI